MGSISLVPQLSMYMSTGFLKHFLVTESESD